MKKFICFIFICSLSLGFVACGGDDDEEDNTYFRVKEADDNSKIGIVLDLPKDNTMITFNIETNLTDWTIEKRSSLQDYWSFDENFDPEPKRISGSGNKTITVYFEKNKNQQDRAAHIRVYYGDISKRTIEIIQKGTGAKTIN